MQRIGCDLTCISPSWFAYAAGLIDGEGCIHIRKAHQPIGPNFSYEVILTVGMCDRGAVRAMCMLFGGMIHLTPHTKNPTYRPSYDWYLTGDLLRALLKAVTPYLLVKKPQAIAAMKCLQSTKNNPRGKRLTPDIIAEREACYLAIREGNRRGVQNVC